MLSIMENETDHFDTSSSSLPLNHLFSTYSSQQPKRKNPTPSLIATNRQNATNQSIHFVANNKSRTTTTTKATNNSSQCVYRNRHYLCYILAFTCCLFLVVQAATIFAETPVRSEHTLFVKNTKSKIELRSSSSSSSPQQASLLSSPGVLSSSTSPLSSPCAIEDDHNPFDDKKKIGKIVKRQAIGNDYEEDDEKKNDDKADEDDDAEDAEDANNDNDKATTDKNISKQSIPVAAKNDSREEIDNNSKIEPMNDKNNDDKIDESFSSNIDSKRPDKDNQNKDSVKNTNDEREEDEDDDEEEEEEEGEEEEESSSSDDEEVDDIAENVCTAEYFLDKIIPEDYPIEISKEVKHINETIERLNRMYNFSNQMIQKMSPFLREMASRFTDFLYEAQLDSRCLGSLFRVIKAINGRKSWALNFLDSTGPLLTSGFRSGKFVNFGEFDQCLETASEIEDENIAGEPIRGQYCLVKPTIPVPAQFSLKRNGTMEPVAKSQIETVNRFLDDEYIETYIGLYRFVKSTILRFGVCVPDKCDPVDLENAVNKVLVRKTGLSVRIGPNCVKSTDTVTLNAYQIVSIAIFGVLCALIAFSTAYEYIYRIIAIHQARHRQHHHDSDLDRRKLPQSPQILTPFSFATHSPEVAKIQSRPPSHVSLLTAFSLIRNTRILFKYDKSSTASSIRRLMPLDTIRLLLIVYFFVANAYLYTIVFAPMIVKRFYALGPLQMSAEKKYFFLRTYYMLDCFVAFSGMGVALAFRVKTFRFIRHVAECYLRYAVPLIFTIGLIHVTPILGSGPLWHLFRETVTHSCVDNVWPTLFFFSNINQSVENICNLPSVFVSLIFQLNLLAPIMLWIASRCRSRNAAIFLGTIFAISSFANLIPRFIYGYKIPYEYREMKSFTEIKHSLMFYGFNPVIHFPAFVFGIIAGQIIKITPAARSALSLKSSNCHHHHQHHHHRTSLSSSSSSSSSPPTPASTPTPLSSSRLSSTPSTRKILAFGIISFISFAFSFAYVENIDLRAPNIRAHQIVMMLTIGRIPMLAFFCWVIYACHCGCIIIVRRFLSSIVWRPLSQLSYGFFITSMIVIAYRLFSIRETTTLDAQNMFRNIVSDGVVSFILAYAIHVTVQQPARNLWQLFCQNILSPLGCIENNDKNGSHENDKNEKRITASGSASSSSSKSSAQFSLFNYKRKMKLKNNNNNSSSGDNNNDIIVTDSMIGNGRFSSFTAVSINS